jgi:hypothetical protein
MLRKKYFKIAAYAFVLLAFVSFASYIWWAFMGVWCWLVPAATLGIIIAFFFLTKIIICVNDWVDNLPD